MTIPIIPGPFSFVKDIGEGIAGAINAKEQARRRQMAERTQTASIVLDLIGKKVLKQNVLATDEMLELFQSINVDFSAEDLQGESLADTKESIELGFLESLQPQTTPELQPGGVLPGISTGPTTQRPESPAEAKARRQATTPTAQRLALGLPSEEDITTQRARDAAAGTTAAVGIGSAQLTALTPIVDTAVQGAFIQASANPDLPQLFTGDDFRVNPIARDAIWEQVKTDAAARGIPIGENDRIIVDSAIFRIRAQGIAEEARRLAAEANFGRFGAGRDDDTIARIQASIKELGDVNADLDDILDNTALRAIHSVAKRRLDAGEQIPATMQTSYTRYQEALNAKTLNVNQVDNLKQQLQRFGISVLNPPGTRIQAGRQPVDEARRTDILLLTNPTDGRQLQMNTQLFVDQLMKETDPVTALLDTFSQGVLDERGLLTVIGILQNQPSITPEQVQKLIEVREQIAPTPFVER